MFKALKSPHQPSVRPTAVQVGGWRQHENRRHNYHGSSRVQRLLTARGWTEPVLADTTAARVTQHPLTLWGLAS